MGSSFSSQTASSTRALSDRLKLAKSAPTDSVCMDTDSVEVDKVAWLGRRHTPTPTTTSTTTSTTNGNGNGIRFDWPGVRFVLTVTGATDVYLGGSFGFNHFNVHIKSKGDTDDADGKLTTGSKIVVVDHNNLGWIKIATALDKALVYEITVVKRTEPSTKGVFSSFQPVVLYGFRASPATTAAFLDTAKDYLYKNGYLEVIGDSDACGFGVEAPAATSCLNIASIDARFENVEGAFGDILSAKLLGQGSSAVTTAWSGKGCYQNAPFAGSATIPELWSRLVANDATSDISKISSTLPTTLETLSMPPVLPTAVVLLLGANDLEGPRLQKDHFINAYKQLLFAIRSTRIATTCSDGTATARAPIFCFQCSARCAASMGSPKGHPKDDPTSVRKCNDLIMWTRECVEQFVAKAVRDGELEISVQVYFHEVDVDLIVNEDYGIMMHRNVNGQRKVADDMHKFMETKLSLVPRGLESVAVNMTA